MSSGVIGRCCRLRAAPATSSMPVPLRRLRGSRETRMACHAAPLRAATRAAVPAAEGRGPKARYECGGAGESIARSAPLRRPHLSPRVGQSRGLQRERCWAATHEDAPCGRRGWRSECKLAITEWADLQRWVALSSRWNRLRAWSASQAIRSGASTGGWARSKSGRWPADMTVTLSTVSVPREPGRR
jgi:hypothetical protein